MQLGIGIPAIENRQTDYDAPGSGAASSALQTALSVAAWDLGVWDSYINDDRIDNVTALRFSAVWACVRLISQTIASLGWHQYERGADGISKREIEDDVSWLLSMQASPEMNAFEFRQVMLKDALTWGNGYAEIERDGFGRLYWLWRIDPSRVMPTRDADGNLWYRVKNGEGEPYTYLRSDQMFHVKGLGPDGIVGYSVIEMARRTIALGRKQEGFGSQFFGRGPMPGGTLKVPLKLTPDSRNQLRTDFERIYGGSANAGRVIVLDGGMEFTPITLPNTDAQFIEAREFSIEEICRWYGVPPHKVADLTHATFSNIEQQQIEFVQDCILPWCRRLESEADIKLFGLVNRGRRYTRLNINTLMRGDSLAQTTTVVQKINAGLMTPDEGREFFDLNPYPDGLGAEPLVQGAMISLETALNPPEPPAPAAPKPAAGQPPEQNGTDTTDATNAALTNTFALMLEDAYNRLLRVAADKSKRAANKGKEWAENPHAIAEVLRPIHQAFALAIGKTPDDKLTASRAELHARRTATCVTRTDYAQADYAREAAIADLDAFWNGEKR